MKTNLGWSRFGVAALILLAGFVWHARSTVTAQSGLALLQPNALQYVGAFRLPGDDGFSYGGSSMAYNPANNSLFVGTDWQIRVGEVSIPTPVSSRDINALPVATLLQATQDPTEGNVAAIGGSEYSGWALGGLLVYGGKLYGTAYMYYDAENTQRISHYSRALTLSTPSFSGFQSVWDAPRTGFLSGWLAPVPREWQPLLGGPALTGQCCIPIVSRTSWGPSAFAFDPANVGGGGLVPASPLLYYPQDHPTLGPWEGSNGVWGGTTSVGGLAIIGGARTLLYIGTNGVGPFCYGDGTADQSLLGVTGADGATYCYDPTSEYKGQHAYPYQYQIWAYDLNDLVAVRTGAKQPWDVVPYTVWTFSLPIGTPNNPGIGESIGGIAYDAAHRRLYIAQQSADVDTDAYRPLIHVFQVR